MNIYVKGLIVAGLSTLVLLGIWFSYAGFAPKEGPNESLVLLDRMEREGVPDFTLPDMEGKSFSIREIKGKLVVLNFWATWCAPCVEEFPSMIAMAEKFGGDLILVTVAADERKEDVTRFVQALKLKSPYWISLWEPELKVAKQYGTGRLPETFILNRDLKLVKKVMNSLDWSSEPVIRYLAELQVKK
jgi:thiol-disulfide isomerase/thioredoxin